ncbi:hypothetical protein BDV96DRAFT_54248 [Lophiotrema nucula]|uniref:F-box domain-containing protein n=1 Tax=Lophiotrema nucula TaxID=690887 RepID=A0A6A5Z9T8_9PLEO|nr:hypothetical protein BDV96DRAFT_54248 [Lophiotrema nucula]
MNLSITTLPQELLDKVFRHCRHDLYALSLTCEALRVATLETLYERILILYDEWIKPNPQVSIKRFDISSPRLRHLLRTILERPNYALFVHHLEVRAFGSRSPSPGWFETRVSATESSHQQIEPYGINQHASRLGLRDSWRQAIGEGLATVLVSLLLSLCPNIQHLTLGVDVIGRNHFLAEFIAQAIVSKSSFHHLKQISIGSGTAERDLSRTMRFAAPNLDPTTYLSFLYFPNLERADLYVFTPTPPDALAWPGAVPQATALKVLRLHETSVTPIALSSLLSTTLGLTTLGYDFCFDFDHELECQEMMSALEVVKSTLEDLQVSCQIWAQGSFPEEFEYEYIVGHLDFHHFELTSLRISPCLLFGLSSDAAPSLPEVCSEYIYVCFGYTDLIKSYYLEAYALSASTTISTASWLMTGPDLY